MKNKLNIIGIAFMLLLITAACSEKPHRLETAGYIDAGNKDIVGQTETYGEGDYIIMGPDETFPPPETYTTPLIESYSNESLLYTPIQEFTVSNKSNPYVVNPIIAPNGTLLIIKASEDSGWKIEKGQSVIVEYTQIPLESAQNRGQALLIGIIQDKAQLEGEALETITGKYTYIADKDGEVYIYLMPADTQPISFKDIHITIK